MTHRVDRELAGFGRIQPAQELSELGWFDGGLGSFSQESDAWKRQLRIGIHKETPMFSAVFQEKLDITGQTNRDLVGF